jgi:hypothetical protein
MVELVVVFENGPLPTDQEESLNPDVNQSDGTAPMFVAAVAFT